MKNYVFCFSFVVICTMLIIFLEVPKLLQSDLKKKQKKKKEKKNKSIASGFFSHFYHRSRRTLVSLPPTTSAPPRRIVSENDPCLSVDVDLSYLQQVMHQLQQQCPNQHL